MRGEGGRGGVESIYIFKLVNTTEEVFFVGKILSASKNID